MSEYENYNFYKNKASMNRLGTVKTRLIKLILPVLAGLEDKGWQPVVAQGLRSLADQQKAIDAGNSSLSDPRRSKHVIGEAVDITDARYGWEGPASNLGYQFWKDLGQLVHKVDGLTWGGDWGKGYSRYEAYLQRKVKYFVDVAHVQLASHDTNEKDKGV